MVHNKRTSSPDGRTLRPSARRPENACGEGTFVNQVAIDVEKRRLAGLLVHNVIVPDLLVQGFGCHCLPQGFVTQTLKLGCFPMKF